MLLFSPSPQAQAAAEVNHLTFTNESKLLFPWNQGQFVPVFHAIQGVFCCHSIGSFGSFGMLIYFECQRIRLLYKAEKSPFIFRFGYITDLNNQKQRMKPAQLRCVSIMIISIMFWWLMQVKYLSKSFNIEKKQIFHPIPSQKNNIEPLHMQLRIEGLDASQLATVRSPGEPSSNFLHFKYH